MYIPKINQIQTLYILELEATSEISGVTYRNTKSISKAYTSRAKPLKV